MSVKWQGEELMRVQSHDELRAGMTVVWIGGGVTCQNCGAARHVVILLRPTPCSLRCAGDGWRVTGFCYGTVCLHESILRGRIYRLQEPPAEANDYVAETLPVKRGVRA